MPTTCVINACPYNKRRGDKRRPTGLTIHHFPPDPELRKLWIEFVSIQNKKEHNYRRNQRLCSLHFAPDSYIDGQLKFRSVPTEFHVRYDTSEDGWCDKPELVFGPNIAAQASKSMILNAQYQNNQLIDEEAQIDDPAECVRDDVSSNKSVVNNGIVQEQVKTKTSLTSFRDSQIQETSHDKPCSETLDNDTGTSIYDEESPLIIDSTDHNEFLQDPLRIEISTANTEIDGSPGHSNSSTDVSMSDADTAENPVKPATLSEVFIYSPGDIGSLLEERGRKRHINDFTESDFDTPVKRARNLLRIKNIMHDLQEKLRNARQTASRWKKKAELFRDEMQALKGKKIE